jgi:hypothetical protein
MLKRCLKLCLSLVNSSLDVPEGETVRRGGGGVDVVAAAAAAEGGGRGVRPLVQGSKRPETI